MTLSTIDADRILADNFAPWVRDLDLRVEAIGPGEVTVRLPWSARLAREGGALSGQAMMAAADTATVLAISAARGGFVPMTTVSQTTSFQRPVAGADLVIAVRVTKLGRTLAFADVTMTIDGGHDVCAHATTVYAILA